MTFTGRRPNDSASKLGKSILAGLSALGTAMADGPKRARIQDIDQTVKDLLQERDHLVKDLIEPGDLQVSEDYDPHWRKPEREQKTLFTHDFSGGAGEARLTECKGRATSSRYHDAHPACPYVEQIHTAHEFTLRD